MKVGDTLVFIGEDITDEHFKNFTYGKQYVIKDFHNDLPDADTLGYHTAVFFENHTYGCLMINIDKYFVTIPNFRNNKINKLI